MIDIIIAFKAEEDADRKKVYDTANFYHFIHTLALLAVPLTKRPLMVSLFYFGRLTFTFRIKMVNI